jgi:hypothetical protein
MWAPSRRGEDCQGEDITCRNRKHQDGPDLRA